MQWKPDPSFGALPIVVRPLKCDFSAMRHVRPQAVPIRHVAGGLASAPLRSPRRNCYRITLPKVTIILDGTDNMRRAVIGSGNSRGENIRSRVSTSCRPAQPRRTLVRKVQANSSRAEACHLLLL